MMKHLILLAFLAVTVWGQEYSVQPGGAPPADLGAGVSSLLDPKGTKFLKDGQPLGEIWYRTEVPTGAATSENNLTMPNVPHGTLLAVIRFDQQHADRRGQTIKPGLYTLRYSYFPENGTHQGAAPQRDFLLLVPAAGDTDGKANLTMDALLAVSRKASGTPHPAVLSIWKEDPQYFKEGTIEKQGEHDWVLMHKIGAVPVSLILAGKAEG